MDDTSRAADECPLVDVEERAATGRAVVQPATWITRLALHDFRNYAHASLEPGACPVVLVGHNGAGKTNVLEAVSLLSPGRGLRRAAFPDMTRARAPSEAGADTAGSWSVSAKLNSDGDDITIGTGLAAEAGSARGGRVVRIDGAAQKSANVLADYTEMMWLTPASDGLFTGPAAERRRFLDRLVLCFDPAHGARSNQFDRAMRQRNKLFEIGARSDREFTGLEDVLAQTGVAIAAARATLVERLQNVIARRRETSGDTAFPDAVLALDGGLEQALTTEAASDVEEAYRARLAQNRGRDHAARRTLEGPHRSDLVVTHGPKDMIARLCSTGEQKALLVGLVLAHADMLARRAKQAAPFLLLDEIAAHLDAERRAALFDELSALGSQAWMTGTDRAQFAHLDGRATFFEVTDGHVAPM